MTKALSAIRLATTPRRCLPREEAAIYVGMGATKFEELVAEGIMPRPRLIGGKRVWDTRHLDAAIEDQPIEGQEKGADTWADV